MCVDYFVSPGLFGLKTLSCKYECNYKQKTPPYIDKAAHMVMALDLLG